jgi:hypothetical protein
MLCTFAEEVAECIKWRFNGDKVQRVMRDLDIHIDNIKFILRTGMRCTRTSRKKMSQSFLLVTPGSSTSGRLQGQ